MKPITNTPPVYDKKFPLLGEGLKFLNFWGRLRPSDQFLNTIFGSRIFALKRYPKDREMGWHRVQLDPKISWALRALRNTKQLAAICTHVSFTVSLRIARFRVHVTWGPDLGPKKLKKSEGLRPEKRRKRSIRSPSVFSCAVGPPAPPWALAKKLRNWRFEPYDFLTLGFLT